MKRIWLITNPGSGSTTAQKCQQLEALFDELGVERAGRTDFPDDEIPSPADLTARQVDTVVLYAGDGTLNAGLNALEGWDGAFLVLPGGTMNLLAKALHNSTDMLAIAREAHGSSQVTQVPVVVVGEHMAFVGLILGPAANWVHTREAARAWAPRQLWRAARLAWIRSFGHRVHIRGAPGLRDGYQAVLVRPTDSGLSVIAVDARDWRAIAEIGWNWITGDWLAARPVTEAKTKRLELAGKRPVLALFDGEPENLPAGTAIEAATSPQRFVTTGSDR